MHDMYMYAYNNIIISREKLYNTSTQKCAQSNMTRARDEVYCSNFLENVNRDVFRGACTMTSDSS